MELVLIAIGLSMDAFAVAMCKGLGMKKFNIRYGTVIALFFGAFQGIMPLIGWILGRQFEQYIVPVDHWIAFGLLAYIGGRMIYDARNEKEDEENSSSCTNAIDYRELLLLAIATSIDALAVGITFAFLQTPIVPAVCLIAGITFALSLAGVFLGKRFGLALKSKAEIAGGATLILIGAKILVEHLGIM